MLESNILFFFRFVVIIVCVAFLTPLRKRVKERANEPKWNDGLGEKTNDDEDDN